MQTEIRRTTFAVILFLIIPLVALGDDADKKIFGEGKKVPLRVPLASTAITVDGVLNEAAWANALVIELNYEVRPGENVPPPVRTEILLLYDKDKLYVGARCYDPEPEAIRARIRDRDTLGGDDWVAVILDTFNDERRSYDFLCNPFGVQYDQIETQNSEDTGWDAIWDSAGKITDWGYAVEMSIPFNQLRFQRTDGPQVWGFDGVRSYPRNVKHHLGAFPRDRSNNCYLCQAIKIEGFEGANPGKNAEISPTFTASRTDSRADFPEGKMEKSSQDAEFGLNARWGFTPNMTLNFAANPDFSQVEADALQLDVNQPFEIFYDEKRPFFTEGADFFDTPINTVYTRMMRDPSGGLKITGKEGSNTIGAYVVRDDLTNLIFPGNQSSNAASYDFANTSSVFRYKRDIGNKYTLGLLATDREGVDYFNRMFGFDGDFRLTQRDRVRVQFLGSSTHYPLEVAEEYDQDSESFGGRAIYVHYNHNTRSHDWYLDYEDYSEGFRADLGFLPRVGYKAYMAGWGHTWWGQPGSWWSMFNFGAGYDHYEDQQGNPLDRNASFWFDYSGAMQSYVDIVGGHNREAYNGEEFDQNYLKIYSSFWPVGNVTAGCNAILGDRIDYANTRPGKRLQLDSFVSSALGLHLRLTLEHIYERMTVDEGRLYNANISQFTGIYQFNTRAFFRAILQYVDYRYDADLYIDEIDPVYRQLLTQFLFSYKLNAQTVLFIGYGDNYYGGFEYGLTQSDRTLFVKLGYAWVL
jgi:hypothetical protein